MTSELPSIERMAEIAALPDEAEALNNDTNDEARIKLRMFKEKARKRTFKVLACLGIVAAGSATILAWKRSQERSVAEELQTQLGPAASLTSREVEMLQSRADHDSFHSHPLTLQLLLLLRTGADFDNGGGVRFLRKREDVPIGEILNHLKDKQGQVSVLHPKFIQSVTCRAWGDTASGFVRFRVPELMEGTVEYRARRLNGKWTAAEFRLPGSRVSIIRARNKEGRSVWARQYNEKRIIWFHKTEANRPTRPGRFKDRSNTAEL